MNVWTFRAPVIGASLFLVGCGGAPTPSSGRMEGEAAGERRVFGGIEMVWCPPGQFMMGSPEPWIFEVSQWLFIFGGEEGRSDLESRHGVKLTSGFWLAKTETTQDQWEEIAGQNPSHFKGENLPVEKVSWKDVQKWLEEINLKYPLPEGWAWDLPTEAQWEFACRAGKSGGYEGWKLDEVGWYDVNSGNQSHPVGEKRANDWGLHDMHGNVWEWCRDWFEDYPPGGAVDPTGPAKGIARIHRGGGWSNAAHHCRAAYRASDTPGTRLKNLGFRVAIVPRP